MTQAITNQIPATNPVPTTPARPKRALAVTAAVLFIILGIAWYIGAFGGNVRVVSPGHVFRSAQLTGNGIGAMTACWTGHGLEQVMKANGIKTVLNLRGGNAQNGWYREELETCARMGAAHVDVSMSAVREPNPIQLARVLATFDHARYPLLYHCQGGSDRSGLVGTFYLNVYEGVPLDEAEHRQLTMRYAHFSFTRTGAMDKFFEMYRQTRQGLTLRQWITTIYPSLYAKLPESEKSGPPTAAERLTDISVQK